MSWNGFRGFKSADVIFAVCPPSERNVEPPRVVTDKVETTWPVDEAWTLTDDPTMEKKYLERDVESVLEDDRMA